MTRAQHWQTVYTTKADAELSWFQETPAPSLALIARLPALPRAAVDVGGGQSMLAGELLRLGVAQVSVLDVSAAAIDRAKQRLGADASRVRWIVGDALDSHGLDVDLWHDRAVFHFLTDEADRRRYVEGAASAVRPGGHAVVATFAPSGPERCSGLPVRRYDAESLASEFGDRFTLVHRAEETHTTPWGKTQDFVYAVLRRTGGAGG